MKLALSDSQTLLQDTVVRLFRERSTPAHVRKAEETGFDTDLWRELSALGITTMRAEPPAKGGMSLLDAAIVAEEAGRNLAAVPLVEAIVANSLLTRAGAPEALLAAVAAGAVTTLALHPCVAGQEQVVPGGAVAAYVVGFDGESLFVIAPSTPAPRARDVAASATAVIDLTRADAGARTELARGAEALALYQAGIEEWKLLTAAAIFGLGRQALELAAAYSGERQQFGKLIGSYQGVSHPLADSATDMEGGKLLVWHAIAAIAEGAPDAAALISMAFWWAAKTVQPAVRRAMRTFGGYGLSLEYDAQLYYRRAKLLPMLAGPAVDELDRAGRRLWLGETTALPEAGDVEISFDYGAEAWAYAKELRAFVEANMTEDVRKKVHHSTAGHHPGFYKKMAEAGHAFPDMAASGHAPRSRYAVMAAAPLWEDLGWTRTPVSVTEFTAKMCELWSQPEAKAEILPRMMQGDALGCLGFSEPSSGSDVFGARFSAVRDADGWVMNGQKMFTTNGHNSNYILMLTRTDSSGRKHEGLTMFLMPLNLPGVEIHPVLTIQDERTNIVYWSDVRIADKYRLGEVGDGARVMASALSFEHGGSGYHAAQKAMMRRAVEWARRPRNNGTVPMEDLTSRRVLAEAAVRNEVSEVLCRREVWADVEGTHSGYFGQMAKMFATEAMTISGEALQDLAAPEVLVRGRDADLDIIEVTARRGVGMTIYGGSSEVHRSVIAEKALGTPKSR